MNSKIYQIGCIVVLALIPILFLSSCGKSDNPEANKRDSKGNTVLMKAVKEGNIDWVTELLKDGARVDAKGENGKTVLMWAVDSRRTECVKVLLEAGANVNVEAENGTRLSYWLLIEDIQTV